MSRLSSASGGSTRVRAAASSIASGRPSSRTQIAATAAAFLSVSLKYGSTRRAFTAGAGLTFLLLSAGYALILTCAAWIEDLTGGWGLNGAFFRTFYLASDDGWIAQWWIYFCWFVFFFFTGMIFAAVFVRWKAFGLTASLILLGLLVLAVVAAITLTEAWPSFWHGVATLGTLGIASVLLVPAVLAAAVGHLLLRRATPRN